ncbi:hypothetical protein ScPMuIL_007658 [Solemya velum]
MSSQRPERVTRRSNITPSVSPNRPIKVEKSQVMKEVKKERKRTYSSSSDCTEKRRNSDSIGENILNSGIRTRLSTGSIHMNGTSTISASRELEPPVVNQAPKESPNRVTSKKRTEKVTKDSTGNSTGPPPKKRKIGRNDGSGEDNRNDYFCWLCHKEGTVICCELCPRVYHAKCLEIGSDLPQDWVCPECEKIMRAECIDTRSKAMSMISLDTLCTLLSYVLERMQHQGSEPFQEPVDLGTVPSYTDYVYNPMDLTTLRNNVDKKMYGCTEAFLADAKWILHNCIIYNGTHHKLTTSAKMMIRICKHETTEIEVCPDCYLNSCVQMNPTWFCDPCRFQHPLVWAKLKGYPFWPAKVLREVDGHADVRFFGAHDRAWVPYSQMFLLSSQSPSTGFKKRTSGFDHAIKELNSHIKKLREKYGGFDYAPFRTPYDRSSVSLEVNRNQSSKSPKKVKISSEHVPISAKVVKSVVVKMASAVRNKYSSMSSTKREYSVTQTIGTKGVIPDKSQVKSPTEDHETKQHPVLRKRTPQKMMDPKIVAKIENDLKKLEETDGIQDPEVAVVIENVENENDVRPLERKPKDNVHNGKIEEKYVPQQKIKNGASPNSNNAPMSSQGKRNNSQGNFKVLSPSKKEYLENLKKTIESCKAKLGMSKEGSSELKEIIAEGEDSEGGVDDKESDDDSYASDSMEESEKEDKNDNTLSDKSRFIEKGDEDSGEKSNGKGIINDKVHKLEKPQSAAVEKDIDCKPKDKTNNEKDSESSAVDTDSKIYKKEVAGDETGLVMEVDEEPDDDQMQSCDTDKEISPSKLQGKPFSGNVENKDCVTDMGTKIVKAKSEVQEASAGTKPSSSSGSVKNSSTTDSDVTVPKPPLADNTRTTSLSRTRDPSIVMDKFAKRLMESIQGTFGEMWEELKPANSKVQTQSDEISKLEFEKLKWEHQQELDELRHNFQLTLAEMKACWDAEKIRLSFELKNLCQKERENAVQDTKKKQWCANCGKEAIFYCCWNTSYCNYPCQQAHWPQHMQHCMQSSTDNGGNIPPGKQLGQTVEPLGMPTTKSVSANNTVGHKNESELTDYKKRMRNGLTAVLHRQEEERQQERQRIQFTQNQSVPQQNNPLQYSQPQPIQIPYSQTPNIQQTAIPLQTLANQPMTQVSTGSVVGNQPVPGQSPIQVLVTPSSTIGVPPPQPFMTVGARPFVQPQPLVPIQTVQVQHQRNHTPSNQTVLYPMIQPKQSPNAGNFVRLPGPKLMQQSPNQNIKFM